MTDRDMFRRILVGVVIGVVLTLFRHHAHAGNVTSGSAWACPAAPTAAQVAAATQGGCGSETLVQPAYFRGQAYTSVSSFEQAFSACCGISFTIAGNVYNGDGATCTLYLNGSNGVDNYRLTTAYTAAQPPPTNCSTSSVQYYSGTTSGPPLVSSGGCTFVKQEGTCAGPPNSQNCTATYTGCGFPTVQADGSTSVTGISGSPATPSAPTPQCAVGLSAECGCTSTQVWGTFNGVGQCMAAGTAPGANSSSQTQQQSSSTAPNGDVTSSTQSVGTTCSSGTCTTTTTTITQTTNAAGQATGPASQTSQSQTVPQQQFCQTNPSDPACKSTGSASGDCSVAKISCSGDAVQCYAAQQQHDAACALNPPPNPQATKAAAILAGLDPLGASLPTMANAGVKALPGLNTGGRAWGNGPGLQDVSYTFQGSPMVIALSRLNPLLAMGGNIFVLVTAVACAAWLFPQIRGA